MGRGHEGSSQADPRKYLETLVASCIYHKTGQPPERRQITANERTKTDERGTAGQAGCDGSFLPQAPLRERSYQEHSEHRD